MIEHWWKVAMNGQEEMVEWDSVTKTLIAPPIIALAVYRLVDNEATVYLTPVGPRVTADVDDPLAAWATISSAIEFSRYELVGGSPAPIEPEMELEGNPANE